MSTLIINTSQGAATLPPPYRGTLGPGRGAIVSDSMSTVLANLGGAANISLIFRLETSSSPGNPANDPAPSAPVPNYTTATRPVLPSAALPAGSAIFDTTSGTPVWVSADGLHYVDVEGNPT
jgi:hypothetical protein